ncbi:c-type cytochrome [Aquimarina litoralis]|uniref:c-type cytochrome n=1 Tax=Aquimarina litoralis TaxID=584605 RepID=UPI001C588BF9|nr:cytochrome c [Aquimarina litoralis]MBW1296482.1 cytochrome c [Aquimarina litoralis]
MKSLSKIKLASILLISILYACETNVEEETEAISDEFICNEDVSFTVDIQPIIQNNCLSCHGGNQSPDLRTFENIRNNASRVRTQVVNRTMPIGGTLSSNEIERIRCWIDNGALNN